MQSYRFARAFRRRGGFTFVEAMVVLGVLLILVSFFAPRLLDRIDDAKLDRDVNQFVTTLRGAVQEAILRKEKLAVVIEVHDGYYSVYQESKPGEYDEEGEPFFPAEQLRLCWIDEMKFEDGENQYSGKVIFWATPEGWSGSVLFHLIDDEDRQRFVRIDRYTTRVLMQERPLELLEAKSTITM